MVWLLGFGLALLEFDRFLVGFVELKLIILNKKNRKKVKQKI